MDKKNDLENVINAKVKPRIDEAMQKFIGFAINEISTDITDRIKRIPILDIPIDTTIPFKEAKKQFKKQYIIRLLQLKQCNISHVAKFAKIDRRSIHRLIIEMKINVDQLRKKALDTDYLKQASIKSTIEKTLDVYKDTIKAKKLKKIYSKSMDISADILKDIPQDYVSMEDAEKEFEKRYLYKALEENNFNISHAARRIGLRYETLHRKVNKLKSL